MHRIHSDGALFTYVVDGKLNGIVTTHLDDLTIAGDDKFERDIESMLQEGFKFSKIESNKFKYCGCNVTVKENGTIELDQDDYVDNLEKLEIPEDDGDSIEISKQEIKKV